MGPALFLLPGQVCTASRGCRPATGLLASLLSYFQSTLQVGSAAIPLLHKAIFLETYVQLV